jgi:probable phosphoglycerate mutase
MTVTLRQLLFVRHAESVHHVKGLTGGWTDTPLTGRGRGQAEAAAAHLGRHYDLEGFTLFSSDLKRATETTACIAMSAQVDMVIVPELREINLGAATGLTLEAAERIALPEPPEPDLDWFQYEGAESYRAMHERLCRALALIRGAGCERAVVVGHGLSGQELIRAWLGVPLEVPLSFALDPASISELCYNAWDEPQIARLNLAPSGQL